MKNKRTLLFIILLVAIFSIYKVSNLYSDRKIIAHNIGNVAKSAFGVSENIKYISKDDVDTSGLSISGARVYFSLFLKDITTIESYAKDNHDSKKEREAMLTSILDKIIAIQDVWKETHDISNDDLEFLNNLKNTLYDFHTDFTIHKGNGVWKVTNPKYLLEKLEIYTQKLKEL